MPPPQPSDSRDVAAAAAMAAREGGGGLREAGEPARAHRKRERENVTWAVGKKGACVNPSCNGYALC